MYKRQVLDAQVQSVEDRTVYSNSIYGIEKKALPFLLCATNMPVSYTHLDVYKRQGLAATKAICFSSAVQTLPETPSADGL